MNIIKSQVELWNKTNTTNGKATTSRSQSDPSVVADAARNSSTLDESRGFRISSSSSSFYTTILFALLPCVLLFILSNFISSSLSSSSKTREDESARHLHLKPQSVQDIISSSSSSSSSLLPFSLEYHPPGSRRRAVSLLLHSSIHCVGENFDASQAWMYRSCQFQNLCLDLDHQDFVVFPSLQEIQLQKLVLKIQNQQQQQQPNLVTISSLLSPDSSSLSLGSIHPTWNNEDAMIQQLKWFPRVVQVDKLAQEQGYYTLPTNVVLVLFHSMSGMNPNSFVWHDFWPIFTLLQIFGLADKKRVLAVRYSLPNPLPDTCDSNSSNAVACQDTFQKFQSLLLGPDSNIQSQQEFFQNLAQQLPSRKSPLVCAPYAAAGMGLLSDTSAKHSGGQDRLLLSHNRGLGARLLSFSFHLLQNMGLVPQDVFPRQKPLKVTFAIGATEPNRKTLLFSQIEQLKKELGQLQPMDVDIQTIVMDPLPVLEQARIASQSAIFVSVFGGGEIPSIFLAPGSSLIVIQNGSDDGTIVWDYLKDAAYLRVHQEIFLNSPSVVNLIHRELKYLGENGI